MSLYYPEEELINSVIQSELAKHPNDTPEWQTKAKILNKVMDREEHYAREVLIYNAETNIYRMLFDKCTKKNHPFPNRCQDLYDIFAERKAYELSYFNDKKKPKLSPPLDVDYSKMPFKE